MWAACTAIAGGVCFLPCLDGGYVLSPPRNGLSSSLGLTCDTHRFLDPICDGCLAAMGAFGCHSCIENHELAASTRGFLVDKQDRITQSLQSQYCIVPKAVADIPKASVGMPAPSTAAGASVPAGSVANA